MLCSLLVAWAYGLSVWMAKVSVSDGYTLQGRITDADGKALSAVTIVVEGSSHGTYSDADGLYSLTLPEGEYVISVSCIGYEALRRSVSLTDDLIIDFTLRPSSVVIDAVEVRAKGKTQQLREGVWTVSAVDVRPMVNALTNLNELIDRSPGIKVRQEGGVGSDYDLSINGLSGNSVRYFVDGVPMDTRGSNVNLSNLPVNIIERVEIYKGVVPAHLGTDALGGAVNIITKREKGNYVDASYGIGSFHTHRADIDAQWLIPGTKIEVRPTVGVNYSKNDYTMKGVELWDEDQRAYLSVNRKRFHDDYLSLQAELQVGVSQVRWADEFYLSASYAKEDKELQTGSIQTKVYGKAEKNGEAWSLSARYSKRNFLVRRLTLRALLSHTWDNTVTIDTAYRQYDWNGDYIEASRNEITGRARSLRRIHRPLTMGQVSLDYALNAHHDLSLNYTLSTSANDRTDDYDDTFTPANDRLTKHIVGLTLRQSLLDGRMDNVVFVKDYAYHASIEQTDLYWLTGSDTISGGLTKNYTGYGVGSRLTLAEPLAIKASYEHSVRLPLARELLGNGATIYANVGLEPETSDNVNIGLFGTLHPTSGHTLYYEVGGFLRYVDNYIQAEVSEKEGMMQYVNRPAIHVKGIEAEMHYDLMGLLQVNANFSWQDARDRQKYKTDGKQSATYNNRVPNMPWMFGSAEATYTLRYPAGGKGNKLRISATYQGVHWYYLTWEAYGSAESKARIPAQHIFGANIVYSWKEERWNIAVDCQNLFDRRCYDNYMLQKPGRAFFAKIRMFWG